MNAPLEQPTYRENKMQPYVNMGIRFRGITGRKPPYDTTPILRRVGSAGGKGIARGTEMVILKMLSTVGMTIEKIPFWKKLYRQGRRG